MSAEIPAHRDEDGGPSTKLHPQAQALIDALAARRPTPVYDVPLAEARTRTQGLRELVGPGPEIAEVSDLTIPSPAGGIPARLFRPSADAAGLLVWFHAGGWVLGAVEDSDAACRKLALASGCDLLSVEYRLAPEHRFPAGVDDAVVALRWAADALADGRPLLVGGESAGGNLAAVCAQVVAEDGPEIVLQVLVCPVTDHRFDTDSYREHGDAGLLLGRAEMSWFWDQYVPAVAQRDDPRAAPLRAADLRAVAPAYVLVAGFDPLHDEGIAYAARLQDAGVPVVLKRLDDVMHGFFTMVNLLERADQAVDDVGAAIRDSVAARVRG